MNNYEEMKIESDVFTTARENFDLLTSFDNQRT